MAISLEILCVQANYKKLNIGYIKHHIDTLYEIKHLNHIVLMGWRPNGGVELYNEAENFEFKTSPTSLGVSMSYLIIYV